MPYLANTPTTFATTISEQIHLCIYIAWYFKLKSTTLNVIPQNYWDTFSLFPRQ